MYKHNVKALSWEKDSQIIKIIKRTLSILKKKGTYVNIHLKK